MNMLSSLQDGSGAVTLALRASTTNALIDGPKEVLWFGFGAFILIFIVALYMIIHARVIAPSKRTVSERAVFEPAGKGADITFDEPGLIAHDSETHSYEEEGRQELHGVADDISANEPFPNQEHAHFKGQPQANLGTLDADSSSNKETRHTPFAGLFSRKSKRKEAPQPAEPIHAMSGEERWADTEVTKRSDGPASNFNSQNEPFEYSTRPSVQTDHIRKLDDDVEARRRQAELEDDEHINYEQDEFYARQRAEELREAEFKRQKSDAALEERLQSLATMERTLSETADTLRTNAHAVEERLDTSIEERFAALSEALNTRLDQAEASDAQSKYDQALKTSERTLAEMADYVGRELGNLRTSMQESLIHLSKRVDQINPDPVDAAAITRQLAELKLAVRNRVSDDTEKRVSLIELVRGNFPVNRYSFGDPLPSGDNTDCRVKLTSNDAPLVIDGHFPVSAYDQYKREKFEHGKSLQAANEYRRAILRHINFISEKMIVAGETADSAMMFAPSDSIMTDLHANFPDLIEDSRRVCVWIVSPSSLIATLQVFSALAPSPSQHELPTGPADSQDDAVLSEIEDLRQRLTDHDLSGADTPPDVKSTAPESTKRDMLHNDTASENDTDVGDLNAEPLSLSPEEEAFERLEQEEKLAEFSEDDDEDGDSEKPSSRPPFPLR